jgi:hypothetical protein
MPQRRQLLGEPRHFIVDGSWPQGTLAPDAPLAARYAQVISVKLVAAVGGKSASGVARSADLARSTLHDLTTGRSWPDVVSLAKLEGVLGTTLWPEKPLR